MEARNLYVGLDLGNEYTQLCCFHPGREEIITLGGDPGDSYYLIPTVLGVTEKKKEWLYGEDAKEMAERNEGVLINQILETIRAGSHFFVYRTKFEGVELLVKWFRRMFLYLRPYYPNEKITQVIVTMETMHPAVVEAAYEALSRLGLKKDRAVVKSHEECYVYYALSQRRELWLNDIALFHLGKTGFFYNQINVNRKTEPYSITIREKAFGDILKLDKVDGGRKKKEMAGIFEELAQQVMAKQAISTIYVSGEGFLGDWADSVLREFCAGRRVFKGPNLYCRGALYGARHLVTGEFDQNFMLLGDHIVDRFLYVPAYKDGKIRELEVVRPGKHFDTIDEQLDLILDGEKHLKLLSRSVTETVMETRIIELENCPEHKDKMFRLRLRFRFQDARTCIVTVRDLGFGDYAPGSFRVWEKKLVFDDGAEKTALAAGAVKQHQNGGA